VIAIRQHLHKLLADERGATAIEYGLIVGLIACAIIGGITALGGGAGGMWTDLATTVQTSMS
jgi:pilus assembly protein Flp/PilA